MQPSVALYLLLQELRSRTSTGALAKLYPDAGPLRRELYPKHTKMFSAGKDHNQRCCLGGNRVGKSWGIGAYETALHLTGLYPEWWEGKRFEKPIRVWTAGEKGTVTRNINQRFLLGTLAHARGFTVATGGLVPRGRIIRCVRRMGVQMAVDYAIIRHLNGWENRVDFKSYEEGRKAFQADAVDFIWLDEEPPKPIYDECLLRTLTVNGSILATFTPLEGITETVLAMLEGSGML